MFQPARRLLSALGIAVALVGGYAAPTLARAEVLRVDTSEPRYAAIVVDANTGEVLYSKRADSPRYPASVTKVMTLYLTFEALNEGRLKLTDRVVFSPHAAAQSPTKLGVRAGDSITVEEAIKAIAVKSANDVATAMAEKLGGTESRFAQLMTLRARELGMTRTNFVNANGLPNSRQISTARDLAIMSRAVMRDFPQYYSYFSLPGFTFRGTYIRGHNHLLGSMPGFDGLKTGYTNASGFNLAGSAVRDGHRLIAVVLGGPSAAWRDDNMEDLLLAGFDTVKRRDRGDRVMFAANLFEDPESRVYRAPVEQGDSEQDGMQIQLTNNPSEGQKYAVQQRMDPIANPRVSRTQKATAAAKKGGYAVQVGAFKQKAQAKEHLSMMSRRFGKVLSDGDGEIADKEGGYYRVRYTGMSQDDARAACKTLRAKAQSCLVTAN
ncbi:MAG TPA: D-alanyl-D-alanine carboxypeptidase [Caulobacteraceae bacterium]